MIKLFLTDCDSTLTDGIYQTNEKGEISKNFFTRDFYGMWMLSQLGVKICIITAANDDVILHQCRRGAKYADLIKGTKDKVESIEDKYVDFGPRFSWDEIAFIGDDVLDCELLGHVGLAACPIDAESSVLEFIKNHENGFVSTFSGGYGCVREFVDYVTKLNGMRIKSV